MVGRKQLQNARFRHSVRDAVDDGIRNRRAGLRGEPFNGVKQFGNPYWALVVVCMSLWPTIKYSVQPSFAEVSDKYNREE
jgi:hypothetical protein